MRPGFYSCGGILTANANQMSLFSVCLLPYLQESNSMHTGFAVSQGEGDQYISPRSCIHPLRVREADRNLDHYVRFLLRKLHRCSDALYLVPFVSFCTIVVLLGVLASGTPTANGSSWGNPGTTKDIPAKHAVHC